MNINYFVTAVKFYHGVAENRPELKDYCANAYKKIVLAMQNDRSTYIRNNVADLLERLSVILRNAKVNNKTYKSSLVQEISSSLLNKWEIEAHEIEVFRNLANAMPLIVWTADYDGFIDFYNKPYYDYAGMSPELSRGWGWEKVIPARDLEITKQKWMESIVSGEPYSMEHRLRRAKDGMERWHMSRALPVRNKNGKIIKWYGTTTDIHDYKVLTDKLKKTQKAAVLASATKSAFLANMSHEIRTPLGAILGFVDLMQQPNTTREDLGKFVSIISRNSKQLLKLVDDILDLSKVEAGKVVLENLDCSLIGMLADIYSLMEIKAKEKGIAFEIVPLTALPNIVTSDPVRLRQILCNAIGNAIKFTDVGKVQLSLGYYDSYIEFRIRDTGRGISEEQVRKLFQPFSQADSSTAREYGGTGLGLVLTKRLCEAFGGDYWLDESELGKGSTFIAGIPVSVPNCAKIIPINELKIMREEYSAEKIAQSQPLSGKNILVVEDTPDNQKLISIYLEKLGCNITMAANGKLGIDKALNQEFDLVLMDIQMPLMDGYQATRELRSLGYQKPIIALTAHAMTEERSRVLQSGFDGFLSKPIQRGQLVEALENFTSPKYH